MSDNGTLVPPVNSIRAVRIGITRDARYNYWGADDALLADTIHSDSLRYPYLQKCQRSDYNYFYIVTTGTPVATIRKCGTDEVMETLSIYGSAQYQYVWESENGNEYTGAVYPYRWKFDDVTYPDEGKYYLHIAVTYSDATEDTIVSEPLWVRSKHKKTTLIEYTNTENDYHVLFKDLAPLFCLRVDSRYVTQEPASVDVNYTDQNDDIGRLYGNPYRLFNYKVQGPEYIIDKINRAFCCDRFRIEGKRYQKDEESGIEQSILGNSNKRSGVSKLREISNAAVGSYTKNEKTIFEIDATYPKAMSNWYMTDGVNFVFADAKVFDNITEINNYVTYLNNTFAPTENLNGVFAVESSKLIYKQAQGEDYIVSQPIILTTYLSFDVTSVGTVSGTDDFTFNWRGGLQITEYGTNGDVVYGNVGTTFYASQSYLFDSTGTYTIRVFMADTITGFTVYDQATKIIDVDYTSNVSLSMQNFALLDQNIGGSFDIKLLRRCRNEIVEIAAGRCALTGIIDDWGSSYASSGTNPAWAKVQTYYFEGNAWTVAEVDQFIIELHDNVLKKYGASVYIKQTPAAVPSASTTELAALKNPANWGMYVSHD